MAGLQPDPYTEKDLRFLSVLADGLALIIANVLDSEVLRRTQSELKARECRLDCCLFTNVYSNLDLRELLREICASVRQVMACDGVGIALLESGGEKVRLFMHSISQGARDYSTRNWSISLVRDSLPWLLRHYKPVIQNRLDPAAV